MDHARHPLIASQATACIARTRRAATSAVGLGAASRRSAVSLKDAPAKQKRLWWDEGRSHDTRSKLRSDEETNRANAFVWALAGVPTRVWLD